MNIDESLTSPLGSAQADSHLRHHRLQSPYAYILQTASPPAEASTQTSLRSPGTLSSRDMVSIQCWIVHNLAWHDA
ncbi:hypothetical protein KCU87_g422, partial [Aureobasidium melanogenum]